MGAGSTQVSTSSTAPWKGQQKYLLKGFDKAESVFNTIPEYYPGETVAGFDPMQTRAQDMASDYIQGPRAQAQQNYAEGALLRGLSGQTGFSPTQTADLLAGNVRTGAGTPYAAMADALSGDVVNKLQGSILPGIRQQQVMYQPGGSSRAALQQNKAVTGAVKQGLTTPLANMYSNAYQTAQGMRLPAAQQAINMQTSAMGQYPSIMSAPLNMYGALGDIGAQRRALTQQTMDADMARYQYQATAPQQALANYIAAIQGNYGGETVQTSPGPSGMDQLGQAVGIAGSLAALSDIRMKENITPEGSKWKGLNVYHYNYIGDDIPRRGVMAQDVEVIYPDAVHDIDGIKYVNYGAI